MKLKTLSFTPVDQGWDWITVGFGCIALLGILVLLYQMSNKKQYPSNEISSMPIILLVVFATFLASTAFAYSLYTTKQLELIEISSDQLHTPYGSCELTNIKKIYIYPDSSLKSTSKAQQQEFFLIIEEYGGYRHSISSRIYDISPINTALNKRL